MIPAEQEAKYYRILAYAIQMGYRGQATDWEKIYPQLQGLGLKESIILGVKSALKVPQSIDLA